MGDLPFVLRPPLPPGLQEDHTDSIIVNGVYRAAFSSAESASNLKKKLDGVALLIADPPPLKIHQ